MLRTNCELSTIRSVHTYELKGFILVVSTVDCTILLETSVPLWKIKQKFWPKYKAIHGIDVKYRCRKFDLKASLGIKHLKYIHSNAFVEMHAFLSLLCKFQTISISMVEKINSSCAYGSLMPCYYVCYFVTLLPIKTEPNIKERSPPDAYGYVGLKKSWNWQGISFLK